MRTGAERGISLLAGNRVKHDDECAPREANDQANADEHQGSHSRSLQPFGEYLMCSRYAELMPRQPRQSAPGGTILRRPQIIALACGEAGGAAAPLVGDGTPVVRGLDTPLPLSDTHRHSQGQDGPGRACGVQVPGLAGLWVMRRAGMD